METILKTSKVVCYTKQKEKDSKIFAILSFFFTPHALESAGALLIYGYNLLSVDYNTANPAFSCASISSSHIFIISSIESSAAVCGSNIAAW